jgi:hypothetical protein
MAMLCATLVYFGATLSIHDPSRFYFFGDSWDVLSNLLADWRSVFRPHNEAWMPLFKAFYLLEYAFFGGNHLPYVVVSFALHAAVSMVVCLLALRLGLRTWAAFVASVLFAFSSIHWEALGWTFEQCFLLGALFTMLALYTLCGDPRRRSRLWGAAGLALAALLTGPMGYIAPAFLIAFYVVWLIAERDRPGWPTVARSLAVLLSPALLLVAAVFALRAAGWGFVAQAPPINVDAVPKLLDFTAVGVGYGVVLQTLTFYDPKELASAPVLLGVVLLGFAVLYRKAPRDATRAWFWFLWASLVGAMLVVSLGRATFGPWIATSSRYLYVPLVPFAVLVALAVQWTVLAAPARVRVAVALCGTLLLGYYLLHHGRRIIGANPAAVRGQATQRFLKDVRKGVYPATLPPTLRVLVPELPVPSYVSAPGYMPLWNVLHVLDGVTDRLQPVAPLLARETAAFPFNLARNGGFEADGIAPWRTFGVAKAHRDRSAARTGGAGAWVELAGSAAFSQDVLTACPAPLPRRVFSFSVQVRARTAGAIRARVIFKAQDGTILETYESRPNARSGDWEALAIGGVAPEKSCVLAVDVTSGGPVPATADIDDAIVVPHPATIDPEGRMAFGL